MPAFDIYKECARSRRNGSGRVEDGRGFPDRFTAIASSEVDTRVFWGRYRSEHCCLFSTSTHNPSTEFTPG